MITRLFIIALLPLGGALTVAQETVENKEPNRGGEMDLSAQDPRIALSRLSTAPGYEVNLWASEKDFLELANPVAMSWDSRGRLWVATMPTYPQYFPGVPPADKIIILEDIDHDGRADKSTIFADGLHLPGGFEFSNGGVLVAQQPNLMFLKDTDGDDKADVREIVLHGFGSEDSHHAISAFVNDPGGGVYFQEGTFHHSQVETPHGPVRLVDAGVFRYEPRTQKLLAYVSYGFANPWGHIFDRWGQNFVADASGGANYYALPFSGYLEYPETHPKMKEFTLTKVRPTAGCEIVASRHFPREAQGNFLLNNCIGFHGVKQYRVEDDGSGFVGKEVEPLLVSTDINFRPVDIEFGPDGALYLVDWFNPLVGHMQYSIRDPRRDTTHGRIWRISHKGSKLLSPPNFEELTIEQLLDQLKVYEDRHRYRARQELWQRDEQQVLAALGKWLENLDKNDAGFEHHRLEALWLHQALNAVNQELLEEVLASPDHRARAAATRIIRYWRDRLSDPLTLLRRQIGDEHPRVRLEAIVALSAFEEPDAGEVALLALGKATDYYIDYALTETVRGLEKHWRPAIAAGKPFATDNPAGIAYVLDRLGAKELVNLKVRSRPVLEAMLTRPGLPAKDRRAALDELARLEKSDAMTMLLNAIVTADAAGSNAIDDLTTMLVNWKPAELSKSRERVEQLAMTGRTQAARQGAFAALIHADGDAERAWKIAGVNGRLLQDFVLAVPRVKPEIRAKLYDRVRGIIGTPSVGANTRGGRTGQYVRIEVPGENDLQIAELQVVGLGTNIAAEPSNQVTMSHARYGSNPRDAIDGEIGGKGALSTEGEKDPWFELDLRADRVIDRLVIVSRSGAVAEGAFKLVVLDGDRQPVFSTNGDRGGKFDLQQDLAGDIQAAAISVMPGIAGHDAATFKTLSQAVIDGRHQSAAIAALRKLPRESWSAAAAAPMVKAIIEAGAQVPTDKRNDQQFLDLLAFGRDLAAMLPADAKAAAIAAIDELVVKSIIVKAVNEQMRFDLTEITVEAGRPVQIVFQNPDVMPHNLVVGAPGSLEKIGTAAEQMAAQPDAFAKGFVPEMPEVLQATKLLFPQQNETLRFTAPDKPGDYPYVCTFPGHWRTMNGVMHVVKAK